MPALFVFDLDGTLVDSSQDLADAGNALLDIYGHPSLPSEQVVAMVGDGARELVRRLLTASGIKAPLDEALAHFLECYDTRLLATTRPYDGVHTTLEALLPLARLAVLTNKPEAATTRLLKGLELARYFSDVIGGVTVVFEERPTRRRMRAPQASPDGPQPPLKPSRAPGRRAVRPIRPDTTPMPDMPQPVEVEAAELSRRPAD